MASSFDAMARICPLLSIEATVVADYRVLGDHTTLLVVYYLWAELVLAYKAPISRDRTVMGTKAWLSRASWRDRSL